MYLKPPQLQSRPAVSLRVIFPKMRQEEKFNVFSHLWAANFSLIGLLILIYRTMGTKSYMVVPNLIFGVSTVSLFTASALWHSLKQNIHQEHLFQKLDEIMIFFMIVGTFTPIAYLYIPDMLRTWLLVLMWTLAASGSLMKIVSPLKNRTLSTMIYLGMGWMPVTAFRYLISNMPPPIFSLLILGGVFYSAGAAFYIIRKPDYFHEIFHVMVVCGAICFYLVIYMSL